MRVDGVGRYTMLGETIDDAAGEAFDKSAKLLGLGYPGGPALARLAEQGRADAFDLPRPMLGKPNLDFSFAGLKTAVAVRVGKLAQPLSETQRTDMAASVQAAIVDVLCAKSIRALHSTGLSRLVVAGGVGANTRLRERLDAACMRLGARVHYPELALCTDNGAMIALAAAMRLQRGLAAVERMEPSTCDRAGISLWPESGHQPRVRRLAATSTQRSSSADGDLRCRRRATLGQASASARRCRAWPPTRPDPRLRPP